MALLGIDVGTSGTKVILLDSQGHIAANVTEEHPVSTPQPLWSEQDPKHWWLATCRAVQAAIAASGIPPDEIAGIGLSGQMVGLVTLDQRGRPLRPCILWNDQRSGEVTDELTARIGLPKILAETGNPLFPSFVAPKLAWMARHEPDVYRQIKHVLLPKDYVRYCLTGQIGTEVSDASGTCVFNVRRRQWSAEMLSAMDLPPEWFPPCSESDEVVGAITTTAAQETGLTKGTPVVAGGGDQPMQALGSGIVRPGLCSVTLGTSGVVFAQSARYLEHPEGLLHAFCHSVHGQWYLMGVMLSAGGSFQWLRNLLTASAPTSYDEMTARAEQSPAGCEGLLFLPYLTGERVPYSDPNAKGCFVGLTPRHGQPQLIRAVMEGISFGLLDSLNLMRDLGIDIERVYASGGATRSAFWRQMLADVFETEIVTTNVTEGAAFGAAILAGVGTGCYRNAEEASDALSVVRERVCPDPRNLEAYRQNYAIYRSLYPQLASTFAAITRRVCDNP